MRERQRENEPMTKRPARQAAWPGTAAAGGLGINQSNAAKKNECRPNSKKCWSKAIIFMDSNHSVKSTQGSIGMLFRSFLAPKCPP